MQMLPSEIKSNNKIKMSIFDEKDSEEEEDHDNFFKNKPGNQGPPPPKVEEKAPVAEVEQKVVEKVPVVVQEQKVVEDKPKPGKIANNPFEVKNAAVDNKP